MPLDQDIAGTIIVTLAREAGLHVTVFADADIAEVITDLHNSEPEISDADQGHPLADPGYTAAVVESVRHGYHYRKGLSDRLAERGFDIIRSGLDDVLSDADRAEEVTVVVSTEDGDTASLGPFTSVREAHDRAIAVHGTDVDGIGPITGHTLLLREHSEVPAVHTFQSFPWSAPTAEDGEEVGAA